MEKPDGYILVNSGAQESILLFQQCNGSNEIVVFRNKETIPKFDFVIAKPVKIVDMEEWQKLMEKL